MITDTQREVLGTLIALYEENKVTPKAEEIARQLKRTPGTIRNKMHTLRALNYVTGTSGPHGGYKPSSKAYNVLGIERIEVPELIKVYINDHEIDKLYVQKIFLRSITRSNECKVIISFLGDSKRIKEGDELRIGPTPTHHMMLKGKVIGRDDKRREVLLDLYSMTSVPEGRVMDIATKKLISVEPDMKISRCGELLVKKRIKAAPLINNGKLEGIVTIPEIVRAIVDGKTKAPVDEIAIKDVFKIDMNASLIDCLREMEKHDVGRLIVIESEGPTGIITRSDILLRMTH